MSHSGFEQEQPRPTILNGAVPARVLELAEAGARGRALTPAEVRQVCEALRSQKKPFRNNFQGGVA
jgi:hypothetical protein